VTKGPSVEEPEPVVVRAAMAGDLAAFERLVRCYQAHVWRFLRHLLGDDALAEDVTQETFLRLYQRLPTFAWRSKFSTWVFRVARNAGIDALRSRRRQDRLLEALPAPRPAPGPDSRAEAWAAVASLSPKLREALLLVELFGFTYREAAEVLRVPDGTVKSRVFQARVRLAAWRSEEGRAGEL
jgi:RNA polymerase sigma-70 factor, ECF subfamily